MEKIDNIFLAIRDEILILHHVFSVVVVLIVLFQTLTSKTPIQHATLDSVTNGSHAYTATLTVVVTCVFVGKTWFTSFALMNENAKVLRYIQKAEFLFQLMTIVTQFKDSTQVFLLAMKTFAGLFTWVWHVILILMADAYNTEFTLVYLLNSCVGTITHVCVTALSYAGITRVFLSVAEFTLILAYLHGNYLVLSGQLRKQCK